MESTRSTVTGRHRGVQLAGLLVSLAAMPLSGAVGTDFTVSSAVVGGAYVPIAGTRLIAGTNQGQPPPGTGNFNDWVSAGPVAIGFPFVVNSTAYTTFGVSPHGRVTLGAGTSASFANDLAGSDLYAVVAPWWDHQHLYDNGGAPNGCAFNPDIGVYYEVTGTAPNRVLTIDWRTQVVDVANSFWWAGCGLTMNRYQAKLYEGTNNIEFRYGSLWTSSGQATAASVGLAAATTDFLSLTPAGAGAFTTSTAVSNNTIAQHTTPIAANTVVTFDSCVTLLPATLPTLPTGSFYSQVIGPSPGDPAGPFTYSVLGGIVPPGLTLLPDGTFSGTPTTGGTFTFVVGATDGSCHGGRPYTVTVCAPFAFGSLPAATVGVPYAASVVATGGSGAAVSYALAPASSLPPGLSLAPGGGITGTPALSGSFTFDVTATDAGGCSGTQTVSLVVGCPPVTATVTTPDPTAFCSGGAATLTAAPSGGTYVWSNGATGQSILVEDSGSYSVTVTLPTGCSYTSAPLDVTVFTVPATIAGTAALCTNDSGTASVSTSVVTPKLEWTVTNHTGGGSITGPATGASVTFAAATAGTFAVTCKVTDPATGCYNYVHLLVTALPAPAPVVTAPASAKAGEAGLTASVPPQPGATWEWSITNGSITAGQGTNSVGFAVNEGGSATLTVVETGGNGCSSKPSTAKVNVYAAGQPCAASAEALCLNQSRFEATVSWRNYTTGSTGEGQAVSLTSDSGYFWFLSPSNLELFVKVLDGSAVNGSHWVLFGALSDMEYTLTVTDTVTGAVKTYFNPAGTLASVADVTAFDADVASRANGARPGAEYGILAAAQHELTRAREAATPVARAALAALAGAEGCTSGPEALCLGASRFEVSVTWSNYTDGHAGAGRAAPLTADAGTFWFFSPNNIELAVKVLDGTSVNGKHWVLWGALTDVEYFLNVKDTSSGTTKSYYNPPRQLASGADVNAF